MWFLDMVCHSFRSHGLAFWGHLLPRCGLHQYKPHLGLRSLGVNSKGQFHTPEGPDSKNMIQFKVISILQMLNKNNQSSSCEKQPINLWKTRTTTWNVFIHWTHFFVLNVTRNNTSLQDKVCKAQTPPCKIMQIKIMCKLNLAIETDRAM